MIATWMLWCSLSALIISGAAVLAERALLAGRGPVRLVWVGALALTIVVPFAALRFQTRTSVVEAAPAVAQTASPSAALDTSLAFASGAVAEPEATTPSRNWRALLARLDEPLAVVWITLSVAVAISFFGGIVTLAWMRRGWQLRKVLGIPVYVSSRTGPAVVGVVSPAIVIPEWVLSLEPAQLTLMLRHEEEHRRARDGQLLTIAQFALIAMPWNVALWWQVLRLRVAVELDCDARVLRDADARVYGDLLLDVARPRRGPTLIGVTAFAERATQLERRIRVMGRHRVRTTRAARAVATGIGLAVVTAAWAAPRPAAPTIVPERVAAFLAGTATPTLRALAPKSVDSSVVDRTATVTADSAVEHIVYDTLRPAIPASTQAASSSAAATNVVSTMGVRAVSVTPVVTSSNAPPSSTSPLPIITPNRDSVNAPVSTTVLFPPNNGRGGGPGTQTPQDMVELAYKRLFDGITLSPEREARAKEILAALQLRQATEDVAAYTASLLSRMRSDSLQAQRDAALRALINNDEDRATFDARVAQRLAGGGGRGGGAGARGGGGIGTAGGDVFTGTVSGARIGGGARGGGAGDMGAAVGRGGSAGDMGAGGRGTGAAVGGGGRGGLPLYIIDGVVQTAPLATDLTYRRLFDGISLTADQEATARALITKTQQELVTTRVRTPVHLRVNANAGVVTMRSPSDSALMALVPDDADRAKLRTRIVIAPP